MAMPQPHDILFRTLADPTRRAILARLLQGEPEHLLLALVQQEACVVPQILLKLGVQPRTVAVELESALNRLPKVKGQAQAYLSPALNAVADGAEKEATNFKDEYTSTEHFLLAMTDARSAPGVSALLLRHGFDRARLDVGF